MTPNKRCQTSIGNLGFGVKLSLPLITTIQTISNRLYIPSSTSQLGLASPALPGRSLTRCGSGVFCIPAYIVDLPVLRMRNNIVPNVQCTLNAYDCDAVVREDWRGEGEHAGEKRDLICVTHTDSLL